MMGDELRLRHKCPSGRPAWEGTGHVIVTGGSSEEVRGVCGWLWLQAKTSPDTNLLSCSCSCTMVGM